MLILFFVLDGKLWKGREYTDSSVEIPLSQAMLSKYYESKDTFFVDYRSGKPNTRDNNAYTHT